MPIVVAPVLTFVFWNYCKEHIHLQNGPITETTHFLPYSTQTCISTWGISEIADQKAIGNFFIHVINPISRTLVHPWYKDGDSNQGFNKVWPNWKSGAEPFSWECNPC